VEETDEVNGRRSPGGKAVVHQDRRICHFTEAVVLKRAAKAPMPGTMMFIWEFKLLQAARYHGRLFNFECIILDSIPENKWSVHWSRIIPCVHLGHRIEVNW
jgi:hypothetical protein